MLGGSLDWRGVCESMDTCIYMTESLRCSYETITTLLTNSAAIQNKMLKKKVTTMSKAGLARPSIISKVKVTQPCPTLCHPMDNIVHGILQARILEWVAVPFFRGSSQPRDQTNPGLPHCRWILYQLSQQGSPRILEWVAVPFSRGYS